MINRGARTASEAMAELSGDMATIPLSVRVQPRIKAYYEAQADACGAASASAMVAMVLEGVMAATTQSMADPGTTEAVRIQVSLMRERFFRLFHAHRFTPGMIADVLRSQGITLADIMDDSRILPLLTDEVLEEQAKRFNASVDWLHGMRRLPMDRVPKIHKQPRDLASRIVDLLLAGDNQRNLTVIFVRNLEQNFAAAQTERPKSGPQPQVGYVGVVLREKHRTPGGKPFFRYEPWESVPWDYRETRLAIKSLILWLERLVYGTHHTITVEGREVDMQSLNSLDHGDSLPAEVLDNPARHLKSWDPKDYVSKAEIVLKKATLPNTMARETHERALALKYYGYYELEHEFERLTHLDRNALSVPVGKEWWWDR